MATFSKKYEYVDVWKIGLPSITAEHGVNQCDLVNIYDRHCRISRIKARPTSGLAGKPDQ